ncbi:MAG TPA: hypothetical protein VGO61_00520 [Steroidobacteraceae bacterium]|jgi:hypothetical protein|nr:hypothetical protein [Steroidobacteraceae bacterium]
MANEFLPGEQPGQLEALLERWQISLDLHARYSALDDARYWHVQPWPRHERPQRWIIQLARKRILALKRIVVQRQAEGDRAFIEGIEIMGFLATLVGLTSVERFIPLATHETERRDVLTAKPEQLAARSVAETSRSRTPPAPREREPTSRTAENRRVVEQREHVPHKRTAETTRQMPALPNSKVYRMLAAQRAGVPLKEPAAAAAPKREARREGTRPATVKPKKAPSTVTQTEHLVIADAVRLLGWGKQWHEVAEMIARLAERPSPSEIRRILRTYREQIDAVATRRRD